MNTQIERYFKINRLTVANDVIAKNPETVMVGDVVKRGNVMFLVREVDKSDDWIAGWQIKAIPDGVDIKTGHKVCASFDNCEVVARCDKSQLVVNVAILNVNFHAGEMARQFSLFESETA